jgi:hypothetical protein
VKQYRCILVIVIVKGDAGVKCMKGSKNLVVVYKLVDLCEELIIEHIDFLRFLLASFLVLELVFPS